MTDIKIWQEHKGVILDNVNGFDVIECQKCSFKHIIPIPTEEELKTIYRHIYYTEDKPLYLERIREDLEWWNTVYSELYESFEEFLPPDRRSILDVGSGPGFFLLHGKKRGWKTMGIELSARAVEHSRNLGLNILEDFFTEQTAKRLDHVDVIHMSEVLEHIPNPRTLLAISRNLLNAGGLISIIVPNDYNPFQYVLRKSCGYKPWWVAPPHHINYFDFSSLSKLLSSLDFEILSQQATFPIDLFLLMGDNYVGNDDTVYQCHKKRMNFELNLYKANMSKVKKQFYKDLAKNGIGREIQIIAIKC